MLHGGVYGLAPPFPCPPSTAWGAPGLGGGGVCSGGGAVLAVWPPPPPALGFGRAGVWLWVPPPAMGLGGGGGMPSREGTGRTGRGSCPPRQGRGGGGGIAH